MPLELEITPTDGAKIKLDGATILPEEQNGSESEGGKPVSLGILTDNKNGNGEAVYKMATGEDAAADNDDFEITPSGELRYIGSDSGDFETTAKKNFAISIARYNNQADADDPNRNPQIVSVTINLQDQTEDLTIIPTENAPLTIENGELFLNEGIDGSGEAISLGKIDDAVDASGEVTYTLTTHTDLFEIRGDELFFIGSPLDYENAATAKQYTLSIVRNREDVADAPVERIINLKNLNDTAPTDLVGHVGETETAITDYIAVDNVGNDTYRMVFSGLADGDRLTIDFVDGASARVVIVPQKDDTGKVTGFNIQVGDSISASQIMTALTENIGAGNTSAEDFTTWSAYLESVTYIHSQRVTQTNNVKDRLVGSDATIFPAARATIEVNENTPITEIFANFASTDADNLQALTYALVAVDDWQDFTIDEDTGTLKFAAAPDYENPADADGNNFYEVTIEVSDGKNKVTKNLLVIVKDVTGDADTTVAQSTGASAAEAVPATPKEDQHKWEPSPFDNIFDDDDPFGPIGGSGDGVL